MRNPGPRPLHPFRTRRSSELCARRFEAAMGGIVGTPTKRRADLPPKREADRLAIPAGSSLGESEHRPVDLSTARDPSFSNSRALAAPIQRGGDLWPPQQTEGL